jgi:multisubunit Na+/H+ antiporter MnhG subunit
LSVSGVVSDVLLVAGLAIVLASCAGMALMDDPMDRLHLVTPAAMLGSVGVCASVVVKTGPSSSGLAAILVVVVIVGASPFISHAMARSIVVRRRAEVSDKPGPGAPGGDISAPDLE